MNNRMKFTAVLLGAVIVAILSVALTLAFLSDEREVTDTLTFGEIELEVRQTSAHHEGKLQPGTRVHKDPSIKNIGSAPCYVRATVSLSGADDNQQSIADFIELSALHSSWRLAPGNSWGDDTVTVYYVQELAEGAETPPIFTHFTLLAENQHGAFLQGANTSFDLVITAQAVQARVEGQTFSSPEDAFTQLMP